MKEKEAFEDTLERIGRKLTNLRLKKGYTSHENFAYDYKIPRVQYWRIEKGKTNLTMKSLLRLLDIHKMTIEEFFIALHKESKTAK
ncbi:MAG: helix-turn-helix transcriptional regulator [Bacteroidota bacterium]